MSDISPFQTLLRAYPGAMRFDGEHRVAVHSIENCTPRDEPVALRQRLAKLIGEADSERRKYLDEATQRRLNRSDHLREGDADREEIDSSDSRAAAVFERLSESEGQNTQGMTNETDDYADYDVDDIQLLEITNDTRIVTTPYPRSYECDLCGHYHLLTPNQIRSGARDCPHEFTDSLSRFPYFSVCPRCAHMEHASPDMNLSHDHTGQVGCPETGCSGHLHVDTGDRLGEVRFSCSECDWSGDLEGYCPECHKPSTSEQPAIVSQLRPKPIDSKVAEPLMIDDIFSDRGVEYEQLRNSGRQDRREDRYHWELDGLATESKETIRDRFGIEDIFTVKDVDSVSAVFGYQATVTARDTDLDDDRGRLTRTFQTEANNPCAYVTSQSGRALVFKLDDERLADVLGVSPDILDRYVSEGELQTLDRPELEKPSLAELELIPLLHSYQHALYKAAIEIAGLEDFLGAKILVSDRALVLVEQQRVGAGGLSQMTLNEPGTTLLKLLRRAKELLQECPRNCEECCPACVFLDDAHCHPFVSREVSRYVPANSLLDRHGALEVMQDA